MLENVLFYYVIAIQSPIFILINVDLHNIDIKLVLLQYFPEIIKKIY